MQISKSVEIPRFHKISGNLYEISLRTPLLQQASQQTQFYCETNLLQDAFLLPLLITRSVSIVSSGLSLPPITPWIMQVVAIVTGGLLLPPQVYHRSVSVISAGHQSVSVVTGGLLLTPIGVNSQWWLFSCHRQSVSVAPAKDFRAARKFCVVSYVI